MTSSPPSSSSSSETRILKESPPAPATKKNGQLFPIFQKNFKPPSVNPLKNLQLDMAESLKQSPKRLRRSLLGKEEQNGLTQMVLDAGQKEIGPRVCSDCGLLFSPGDAQDELEHEKAHRGLYNMFTITLWKDVNVIHTFVDGGTVILVDSKVQKRGGRSHLKDFCAWVDSEVGGSGLESERSRLFLYTVNTRRKNKVRVLGCVRMETFDGSVGILVTKLRPDARSKKEPSILVGITRLWTDESFRRKQIASRLMDMVRFHSGIPFCIVGRSQVGILEPSEDGKLFLLNYTGGEGSIYTYNYNVT